MEQLGRDLRGRLARVGSTNNHALSLLNLAGRAGETLDFAALADVATTVILREQIGQIRYEVQCRLAHLAGKFGTPTREASKLPRQTSGGRARAPKAGRGGPA